jgi:hypothetical protein
MYFRWGDPRKVDHLEDLGVDGRITLKRTLRGGMGMHGLEWSGVGQAQMAGPCECGNEPSDSIKCGVFLY